MQSLQITFNSGSLEKILALSFLSFLVAMLLTPIYTTVAFKYKWWKRPRTDAVTGEKATEYLKLHAAKHQRHIPTMAGIITVCAVSVVTLLFNLIREQTWLPLAAMVGAGTIGMLDDFMNIRGSSKIAGMRAKIKLTLHTLVAAVGGLWFWAKLDISTIHVPFLGDLNLGVLVVLVFILVVVATANAVNITDGLDGLAGGLLASSFAVYAIIAFLQERYGISAFCMSMVGALLAYVWFNVFPARFFMGDAGSFAFGTALGVVAMLTDTLVLLPVIGLVFFVEAGSSAVQIASKKFRNGKKVFRIAPIHHHFEAVGWPEAKVTMRFWLVGQMFAIVGLLLYVLGGK